MTAAIRPSSSPRWLGRFLTRRRLAVTEHGTDNVPRTGPVVLAAEHAATGDDELLALFGPRRVHVIADPHAVRACLQVLADEQALGILLHGSAGVVEQDRFHRRAAYLALVSGATVVPVALFRGDRVEIVYGAAYRTARQPWPRTRRLVDATSLDLKVHVLVARDEARRITGGSR